MGPKHSLTPLGCLLYLKASFFICTAAVLDAVNQVRDIFRCSPPGREVIVVFLEVFFVRGREVPRSR